MRKILCCLLLSITAVSSLAATESGRFLQSEEVVKSATVGQIDAKGLKALLDSYTPFIVLDARGNNWHDGITIPGANLASYQSSPEEIDFIIPHHDTLVVVYCYSFTCPLSQRLANYLVELGYINVIEYSGGLKEWRDIAGYPVEVIRD